MTDGDTRAVRFLLDHEPTQHTRTDCPPADKQKLSGHKGLLLTRQVIIGFVMQRRLRPPELLFERPTSRAV
jgi:hypothetical protein